jgi:phosphatidate cytidylyltransferase
MPVGWIAVLWVLVVLALGLRPLIRPGTGASPAAPPAASVVLGIAYLATPLAVLVRWRLELTPLSVLSFLIVIWANDIAAYFVGLAVGRHKLAPRVSPGKSWEGAVGGLAGGLAAGVLLAGWLALPRGEAALWAAAVTVVSQAGDLFESALKRRAGIKDSGRLLPGHGGVLDRFDGVLLAAPVAYLLLRAFAGR